MSFLSSSHKNDSILALILVRNVPDSRTVPKMREFMILALFIYEVARESYFLSIFLPRARTHPNIVRLCVIQICAIC